MTDPVGYWYEHTNGGLHFKPLPVVDQLGPRAYFDSPFVKQWWRGPRGDPRTPQQRQPDKLAPRCPACGNLAALTTGKEIYPHMPRLATKPIWKCGFCPDAYVGCHPGGIKPLGTPAGKALRTARSTLHDNMIDPLWKGAAAFYDQVAPEQMKAIQHTARRRVYAFLADRLHLAGKDECHTGMFDLDRCRAAWVALRGVTYPQIRDWWKKTNPEKEKT